MRGRASELPEAARGQPLGGRQTRRSVLFAFHDALTALRARRRAISTGGALLGARPPRWDIQAATTGLRLASGLQLERQQRDRSDYGMSTGYSPRSQSAGPARR